MSYQVIVPCVIARQQGELGNREFYQGGIIPWLSDEQAEHFLESGLVEEVDGDPTPDGEKPAKNATKKVLVAWIAEHVAKDDGSDYTVEELAAMKVPELRELVDSVE